MPIRMPPSARQPVSSSGVATASAATAAAAAKRTAAGAQAAPARPLFRPIGIGLVEKINPWYVLVIVAAIYAYGWYNEHKLQHLIGKDTLIDDIHVLDGDTFTAKTVPGGIAARFRLKQIDAPERDQPFGRAAMGTLQELLVGHPDREVAVFIWEQDTWGRYVVDVVTRDSIFTKVVFVQEEMVRRGMAWAFGGFTRDSPLMRMMEEARAAHVGLWQDENPVEPWKHRRVKRGDGRKSDSSRTTRPPGGRGTARQQQQHHHQQRQAARGGRPHSRF